MMENRENILKNTEKVDNFLFKLSTAINKEDGTITFNDTKYYLENMLDVKEIKSERVEIVNDLEITLFTLLDKEDGTISFVFTAAKIINDVADYDNLAGHGKYATRMTAIEVYHSLTAERRFLLGDEVLKSELIIGSSKGSDLFERETLAKNKNVPTSDITIDIHTNEVYKHIIKPQLNKA